jgi:hypothetical protein
VSIRGTRNNRKDGNQSGVVAALRKQGAHVRIYDDPCDLIVKYQGVLYLLDVKAIDGAPTKAQIKFNDDMRDADGEDTIRFCRTVDEALFAIGAKEAPYEFEVTEHDETITVGLHFPYAPYITDVNHRGAEAALLSQIEAIQGFGRRTGLDSKEEFMIWPRRGIKVKSLRERIFKLLDWQRIGAEL